MTHRRRPPPPDPDPTPFDGLVICTDHGRHRPLRIAVFDYDPVPGDGSRVLFSQTSRWDVVADNMRPGAEPTFRFKCRICHRDTRIHEGNATAAVEALRQAGVNDLDISALPC